MKKNFVRALLFLLLLPTGCGWHGIRGNGNVKTEQRPVTPFTRVDAGGTYTMEWRPGVASLSLTTDENLLPKIETVVNGNVLKIETHGPIAPTAGIKIVITSQSLGGAELSGAVKMDAAQLSGQRFTLDTSGATKVTLAGRTNRLVASLTGASKLDSSALQNDDVELSVTGAGKAKVAVTNSLKASITGAGKVTYIGDPKSVEKNVTGAGSIKRQP
jgi:Putative auto-transporter adhesin, head GIN domain